MKGLQSGKELISLYLNEHYKQKSALELIESAKRNFNLTIELHRSNGCSKDTLLLIFQEQEQRLINMKGVCKNYPKIVKQINSLLNQIHDEKLQHTSKTI